MATFVLVHGGYHGGWCYSRVADRLRALGHQVHTPTLSGLGERSHLVGQPINLSTHVADVVATIESFDLTDVILCGHSYAGMVITGAAGQIGERIKALFYLDAAVPEDNQSVFDILGTKRILATLQAAGETGLVVEPPTAEFFGVGPDDVAWVQKSCSAHPLACFVQKLRLTGKEALITQRTYVLCEQFQSVNHETYARVKEAGNWKTVSVDAGHDLMIDRPDDLVALLLEEVTR